ncbi:MAG: PEP-utilizing enzyme [Polyangiaceae bacterium]
MARALSLSRSRRPTRLTALGELAGAKRDDVGSRVEELLRCQQRRVALVPTWVLPADVFHQVVEEVLPSGHDPASLLRLIDRPRGLERAARASRRLMRAPLPLQVAADLAEFWEAYGQHAGQRISVSSSPTVSRVIAAHAGLLDTRIGIASPTALADAIRRVWAMCGFEAALTFLRSQKVRDLGMPVVIQVLPDASVTGSMLTRDAGRVALSAGDSGDGVPQSDTRVVRYWPGWKPPPIEGVRPARVLRFDPYGNVLVRSAGGRDGDSELPQQAVSQLAELATLVARDAEAKSIGFLLADDGPLVWDAGEATRLAQIDGGEPGTVWSLASLGEVLPGVATPLTWSVAYSTLQDGFAHAFREAGLKVPRGQSLVTRIDGRVYFNVSVFFDVATQLPALHTPSLLEIMGSAEREVLAPDTGSSPSFVRVPIVLAKLVSEQRRLAESVTRFEEQAEQQRRWLVEMDLAILPDDALKTTLGETHEFFRRTSELLLSCASATLIAYVALKTVLARNWPAQAEAIAQALTSGVGGLDTLGPASAVLRAREGLRPGEESLDPDGTDPALAASLKELLLEVGDRGRFEAELAAPRWREQSDTLVQLLLKLPSPDQARSVEQRMQAVRARADAELDRIEERLPYVERVAVRSLIARYRRFAKLRERARVWLARTASMLRIVVQDAGRRLMRLDPRFPTDGAFFLTYPELRAALASVRADLGPIAALRQAEHAGQLARPDPPRLFVGGPPLQAVPPASRTVLRGLPGGAGVATGKARLVHSLHSTQAPLERGDILVARAADLGFVPDLLQAGALVVEIGGPLSHLTLAARELDVPCVVGVRDAFATLSDGELLRVDGARGVVERLEA